VSLNQSCGRASPDVRPSAQLGQRVSGGAIAALASLVALSAFAQSPQNAYRFPIGPYGAPPGPTNAAVCASQPYWPSAAQACQATKSFHPACDRISAVYRNHVATLTSPTSCYLTWEFSNVPNGPWSPYQATIGLEPVCPAGTKWIPAVNACVNIVEEDRTRPRPDNGDACHGNPIYPLSSTKRERVDTGVTVGWHSLQLTFDSIGAVPTTSIVQGATASASPAAFGTHWFGSLHRSIKVEHGLRGARVSRGDGQEVSFVGNGAGAFVAPARINDRLVSVAGGYRYYDAAEHTIESYSGAGRLTQMQKASGVVLSFDYSVGADARAPDAGYLLDVIDSFGRKLQFSYGADGRVTKITDTTGRDILVGYTGGNLSSLTWQDSTATTFLYENSAFPWALTGVIPEDGRRKSWFGYDDAGRATSTKYSGDVNRYSVSYTTPPSIVVTDTYDAQANVVRRIRSWQVPTTPVLTTPKNYAVTIGVTTVADNPAVSSRSQPPGSGCDASTSAQAFDANRNPFSRDDFNGNRVCYAHDMARNLETVRVEGLALNASCAPAASGTPLPTGSRKISTAWHPDWRLPSVVAEPGRQTTYVYNGRPDPFASNATANCVAGSPLLADGKPLAVLCKMVEQATTDSTGADGFAATPEANVSLRVQTWTYNSLGQPLTHDGPRTDVADLTTFEYRTATTFSASDPDEAGYRFGDLWKTINPAGLVTEYLLYNKSGRLLQSQDSNGVISSHLYDARQRNWSSTVGTQTTTREYWPYGLLKKLTLPDLSWTYYEYDAAHRLFHMRDNVGNSVTYLLDELGNRKEERVKDSSNAERRYLERGIDTLGRIDRITGRE
jgi:YD repeat-containing protein